MCCVCLSLPHLGVDHSPRTPTHLRHFFTPLHSLPFDLPCLDTRTPHTSSFQQSRHRCTRLDATRLDTPPPSSFHRSPSRSCSCSIHTQTLSTHTHAHTHTHTSTTYISCADLLALSLSLSGNLTRQRPRYHFVPTLPTLPHPLTEHVATSRF